MPGRIILTSRGLNTEMGRSIIKRILRGNVNVTDRIFLITMAEYGNNDILRTACMEIGFHNSNILVYNGDSEIDITQIFQYVYVGEGNTFELLYMMKNQGIIEFVRQNYNQGACYIGSSAGAMIAGSDIQLALDFDRNFVQTEDFSGLDLFSGTVIPHYTKMQFNNYYNQLSDSAKAKYKNIYSVSDEGAIIFENNGSIRSVRVKRE